MSLTVLVLFTIAATLTNVAGTLVVEALRPRLTAWLNPPRSAAIRTRKPRGPAAVKLPAPAAQGQLPGVGGAT